MALTFVRLQLPQVDLGRWRWKYPSTSSMDLEDAEDTVAPLVFATADIVDERLLLNDDDPEDEDGDDEEGAAVRSDSSSPVED